MWAGGQNSRSRRNQLRPNVVDDAKALYRSRLNNREKSAGGFKCSLQQRRSRVFWQFSHHVREHHQVMSCEIRCIAQVLMQPLSFAKGRMALVLRELAANLNPIGIGFEQSGLFQLSKGLSGREKSATGPGSEIKQALENRLRRTQSDLVQNASDGRKGCGHARRQVSGSKQRIMHRSGGTAGFVSLGKLARSAGQCASVKACDLLLDCLLKLRWQAHGF